MPLERRFSTSNPTDIRGEWITDRVSSVQSALDVIYGASGRLRTHVRWVTPYRADVSVIESGRLEPRVTIRVTPRGCRLDNIEGTAREMVLRTLQTFMGPDPFRVA